MFQLLSDFFFGTSFFFFVGEIFIREEDRSILSALPGALIGVQGSRRLARA